MAHIGVLRALEEHQVCSEYAIKHLSQQLIVDKH
jgi:predicted acylesterase/phospholipase RssA